MSAKSILVSAIIIIAIAVIAVAVLIGNNPTQSGTGNSTASTTVAPLGSPSGTCHVLRPYGPGSSNMISLAGDCNNYLPQYVAQFSGNDTYIQIASPTSVLRPASEVSAFAWIHVATPMNHSNGIINYLSGNQKNGYGIYWGPGTGYPQYTVIAFAGNGSAGSGAYSAALNPSTWHMVGLTYNGTSVCVWLDTEAPACGHPVLTSNGIVSEGNMGPLSYTNASFYIGRGWNNYTFDGSIADVQIYSTSLSANQVHALYNEGIGGVPINLQSIVGWWPLNNNTKDYSGNNNNGTSVNLSFNSSWMSLYTAP